MQKGKVTLYNGVLSGGFELPDAKMAFITAGDIFGKQKVRRYKAGGKGKQIRYFSDLEPGDYVMVHAGVAIAKITDEDDSETEQLMEEFL